MVVTNIKSPEIQLYEKLNEKFPKAFEIVKNVLESSCELGRYEVEGSEFYYMVQSYNTKAPGEAQFEAHKRYIDIQVMLEGEEIIRFESPNKLSVTKEYDADADYQLFAMSREFDSVRLAKGDMTIIFPGEPHAPAIGTAAQPEKVRKLVIKILY